MTYATGLRRIGVRVEGRYGHEPFLGGKILHNALLGNKTDEAIENAVMLLDKEVL